MFLYHIHTLREDDPVKNVHYQQKLFPFEENWTNEVERLINKYDIAIEDMTIISKNVWKNRVNSRIISSALCELQSECTKMAKTKSLVYDSFKSQKYLSALPSYLATFLLKIRSRTLPCKVNQSSSFQANSHCRLCHQAVENQEHIVNCFEINKDDEWLTLNEYTSPMLHVDRSRLEKIYDRFTRFQNATKSDPSEDFGWFVSFHFQSGFYYPFFSLSLFYFIFATSIIRTRHYWSIKHFISTQCLFSLKWISINPFELSQGVQINTLNPYSNNPTIGPTFGPIQFPFSPNLYLSIQCYWFRTIPIFWVVSVWSVGPINTCIFITTT